VLSRAPTLRAPERSFPVGCSSAAQPNDRRHVGRWHSFNRDFIVLPTVLCCVSVLSSFCPPVLPSLVRVLTHFVIRESCCLRRGLEMKARETPQASFPPRHDVRADFAAALTFTRTTSLQITTCCFSFSMPFRNACQRYFIHGSRVKYTRNRNAERSFAFEAAFFCEV